MPPPAERPTLQTRQRDQATARALADGHRLGPGAHVETINIGKLIVEIGIIGQKLAVASFDGVDLIPIK